ncbi:MAG TPA: YceI family protein [Steroidobacteraceae bacterium]|jgi:polyisoprenoid-binding protein YceI|nr:YceI family protein [Steroidobacteraceae bacterium]
MRNVFVAATSAVLMSAAAGAAAAGGVASYTSDPAQSRLEFTGVQAGAEFKAVFHKFAANVDFSPEALAASHIDVQIEMNSVDSLDKDRDTTMRGKDVFDVAHDPTAHYTTRSITKTAAGFSALGSLTLHGVTKDVPIEFQITPAGAGAKLSGSAKLKRLDFGVGQGDWKSTDTVGDAVKIDFALVLKPKI